MIIEHVIECYLCCCLGVRCASCSVISDTLLLRQISRFLKIRVFKAVYVIVGDSESREGSGVWHNLEILVHNDQLKINLGIQGIRHLSKNGDLTVFRLSNEYTYEYIIWVNKELSHHSYGLLTLLCSRKGCIL